ncbi:PilT protein domain protein [Stanieria cyanosphaera PCC 7437]|uniref:PilT protein domain protein n=1 Tax=Stanieria cyanosphaera (strain ATCC 29371 / PCC 7437) TaxID=111780 RepID=K9XTK8_STAC7|nr:type II toxin-antitoxin system VapC family toxin [Stanieria cyanosphaera]AFZ35935.1 PilT protein domain protein [Stanieria cyanosphaera PCC 7437]
MSPIVFDGSVLIAILRQEPGSEVGEQFLNEALISTVNLAEVTTYLARNSVPPETIKEALAAFPIEVVPFDRDQGLIAGYLYPACKSLGLSLGDRACLALAKSKSLPVLTADKAWLKLEIDISVKSIR